MVAGLITAEPAGAGGPAPLDVLTSGALRWSPSLIRRRRRVGCWIWFRQRWLGTARAVEPWHPWYGRGYYGHGWGYRDNRTVIVNDTNIYNAYRNARVNNGFTYTGTHQFGRGRSAFSGGSGLQLRDAALVRGGLPIAPTRESLALTNRPAIVNTRFASVQNRQFFTHERSAARERVPFALQQEHMAQFQQRTLGTRPSDPGFSRIQDAQRGFAQRGYGQGQTVAPNAGGSFRQGSSGAAPVGGIVWGSRMQVPQGREWVPILSRTVASDLTRSLRRFREAREWPEAPSRAERKTADGSGLARAGPATRMRRAVSAAA